MINIKISYGELFDKISILEIKKTKLTNSDDIKNVTFELNLLTDALNKSHIHNNDIDQLFNELKKVNLQLWEIEDKIREKEKYNIFDDEFIKLARSVYKTNDKRSKIKKQININLKSEVFEIKSYQDY
ncbi:DUF6165 family protein [Alphaproteobacteria bacterium]|nr:DUF6165 family protein [Alphaproteobacteria bacterium]